MCRYKVRNLLIVEKPNVIFVSLLFTNKMSSSLTVLNTISGGFSKFFWEAPQILLLLLLFQ